jgi:hypothetical protein
MAKRLNPRKHFLIVGRLPGQGSAMWGFDAASPTEALRLLLAQHPEIDPVDCQVESLAEFEARVNAAGNDAAIWSDAVTRAQRHRAYVDTLKKGRVQ